MFSPLRRQERLCLGGGLSLQSLPAAQRLLSCTGVGTGALDSAGSCTGTLLYLAFRWSKILLQMCLAEVRVAVEVREEEDFRELFLTLQ